MSIRCYFPLSQTKSELQIGSHNGEEINTMGDIRLFLSHSHADKEIAAVLLDAIEATMVPRERILCTSHDRTRGSLGVGHTNLPSSRRQPFTGEFACRAAGNRCGTAHSVGGNLQSAGKRSLGPRVGRARRGFRRKGDRCPREPRQELPAHAMTGILPMRGVGNSRSGWHSFNVPVQLSTRGAMGYRNEKGRSGLANHPAIRRCCRSCLQRF